MIDLKSFCTLFWQRFNHNKLTQAAGYLTYSTMLAIVPLIMVVFSIFSAFPVFNEVTGALKAFIFTNFAPSAGDVVGQYIDEFVNNSKQMSAVGIISLIVVALMLINSIDRTLNGIWHDTSTRPIFTSFAIYWLILTLGPLLVGTSIAASSYVKTMFEHSAASSFGLKLLGFVPFLSTWFIFTVIYMVVPNKKVSIKHSAAGALIAAVFFTLGKQAFAWYIVTFPSYQLIYGAMATLPIMLLWIQLSWTFVLLGAQLAAVLAEVRSKKQINYQEVGQ
ncbi:membrane protein [Aggregatibacter actinomycetemcomitans serotype e str. SC936]|uniref:virulence factor BrkB family protein n=1 Tax=Aggregatibacter actinomycetemcomitans TaxID=714 RepID=UPI00077E951A|nr:virulence factor BrkB family protein [Aggregatibacter actinomycetemcomitans]KYK72292.1 membrane protein [Aggregatibacter actinomycetemcomitans serotype e str. SA3096]KYK77930.1 membrane protein [Aggregatibacter actinomycetemcomitans serotype e str. SC936]KYK96261.1 membrane protein [Aggregatibacter actinomycetemcomitans serotype e str. ANH9776]TYB21369.1 virulence factor BrkB family protein [Aggregatibacter actinomycetemcomitans]